MDTTDLPMTPEAQVLAGRDASDVPMLLAGVIVPVVLIRTGAAASSLACSAWRAAGMDSGRPDRGRSAAAGPRGPALCAG
ncbi:MULTISPECIES: hypothetical protein [unclassified Streptomyces]|uniref:hypothetical protein n=1 Tax=unclassified Streptomyces TaxID=2593676 RepID=UPI001C2EE146|nr:MULTISPECIES: hypothetical protein [unclassified Streptomyces]MBV1949135.1 hypothetical protein [Streptomyces sp. BV129]